MRREELGSLAMFMAVAEERSFTRAAAKLGISQSALSHSMRRLETSLGLRLLTRTTRSVAPTEAGERLIETLGPALDDIDARLAALTEFRERPAGTVRITAGAHAARALLWPVIDRLTTENPDINVEVNIEGGLVDIVADRYDAGIRLGERLEQDMIAVPISPKLRMAAFASPAYFSARGTPETPYDLANHSCINLRFPRVGRAICLGVRAKWQGAQGQGRRAARVQRCRPHHERSAGRAWHRIHAGGPCNRTPIQWQAGPGA